MFYPDFETFKKLAQKGNLIPVYKEIMADLDTPLSAFLKLGGKNRFLFESVQGGEKWARYSFLGGDAHMTLQSNNGSVFLNRNGTEEKIDFVKDPFEVAANELKRYRYVHVENIPRFSGGLVGYIGYDTVRFIENIGDRGLTGNNIPDVFLALIDTILIFDNLTQKIKVISNAFIDGSLETAYQNATAKINACIERLKSPVTLPEYADATGGGFRSNFTKEGFKEAVNKAKEYIKAGDVIQTVLSQRFEKTVYVHPIHVYRALRVINPSPYMFYLDVGDIQLVGSSPEILVRLENDSITLRPIAGTRRRGKSKEEDDFLEKELLEDPKENAEHVMLVDLGRNDIGRVAVTGTVRVGDFRTVERYSHVMHITSGVEGQLAKGCDMFDLLRATFPAGTVSGAPKIRAMQIIEELEPVKRGPYAGSVGYMSFSGNMDMCITIRTILFYGKTAYIQAGAGIVADSDPESEYIETVNKAMGMLKAIEMAEGGFESSCF